MKQQSDLVPAMVTGVGGGGNGEQILKALRLAETRYEIVGGDMSPTCSGLLKVDHPYLLPPANDPEYVDTVLAVCRKHGVRALFPGSEPELSVMSRFRDRIVAAGVFLPINPADVIEMCMDKVRAARMIEHRGFRVPPYRAVRSVDDAVAFEHLPAVLKPSVGSGGSANILLAQNRDEIACAAKHLLALHDEFIVQAYVGTPEHEYTVGVLTDMDGKLLNSIAVRRYILSSLGNRINVANRSGNSSLGRVLAISSGVSQGEIGRFPEVTSTCESIALALGARGPINLQCRLVDGQVYVFEVNPRFSGTTSLRAMVGYNEPDVLVRRHVLGQRIPVHFPYQSGVIMRELAETLMPKTAFPDARQLVKELRREGE